MTDDNQWFDYGGATTIRRTPFTIGWQRGRRTKKYMSPREVLERHPQWTAEQVDLYLNGLDDGIAGDRTRINR